MTKPLHTTAQKEVVGNPFPFPSLMTVVRNRGIIKEIIRPSENYPYLLNQVTSELPTNYYIFVRFILIYQYKRIYAEYMPHVDDPCLNMHLVKVFLS